jgi:hypothetical protein
MEIYYIYADNIYVNNRNNLMSYYSLTQIKNRTRIEDADLTAFADIADFKTDFNYLPLVADHWFLQVGIEDQRS